MPIAKSPEALFRELVRPPNGPPHLWVHQADLLRSYHRDHLGTSDVALELPTGAGKTLPGLLIAEWRRRAFSERVAYLCPTRQLARQVAEQATRYGIEVVVLVGSAQTWGEADRMRFVRGERVAITTYSAVFNSNPQIADAQTLVLDDAHAAEGFVAGAWTVQIDRDGGPAYEEVLSALANDLDDALLGRLRGPRPELGEAGDVQLVPVRAVHDRAAELHTVLATRMSGSAAFSFSMIRQQLGRCLIYLSWSSILIRPLIPPTFMHPAFDHANQRIYMSATMGEGGELERAFGRTFVMRLFQAAGRAKEHRLPVLAWRQGIYGPALVAAGLDGYECGLGTGEQTNISRRQFSRKPQTDRDQASGGGAGIFVEPLGRSVPRRVGKVLLGDVGMRPKVMCDDEGCCPSVAATLDNNRHHAVRTRARTLTELATQPHRRWRLNHVARHASAAATLAAQANRVLETEGIKQKIKARNLEALAQVMRLLAEEQPGSRIA